MLWFIKKSKKSFSLSQMTDDRQHSRAVHLHEPESQGIPTLMCMPTINHSGRDKQAGDPSHYQHRVLPLTRLGHGKLHSIPLPRAAGRES